MFFTSAVAFAGQRISDGIVDVADKIDGDHMGVVERRGGRRCPG